MRRSEYIQTVEGMRLEHLKRFMKINYLSYWMEPKSKKIINKNKDYKASFKKSTRSQLLEKHRRAHRSKLILEIDFYVSDDNPPAIHQLVKNYLDLLHKTDEYVDKSEGLLFKDDGDIYILMTRIHYVSKDQARIEIKSYNFNLFLKDLEVAKKMYLVYKDNQFNDFPTNDLDNLYEELETHTSLKSLYEARNQLEYYDFEMVFIKQQLQMKYLENRSLRTRDYLDLLSVYIKSESKDLGFIDVKINDFLQQSIFIYNSVEVQNYPTKEGDGQKIKEELQKKLHEFKKSHPFLFPLYHPIRVIIIATEPTNIYKKVDLDNIARKYIIPSLVEIFKPPADFIIPEYIKNNPEYYTKLHEIKGIPKHGIVSYEAIKIPDAKSDLGKINVMIDNGYSWTTAWKEINSVINVALDV